MAATSSHGHWNVPGVTTFEDLVQNENVNQPIDSLYIDFTTHDPVCICPVKCIIKINFLQGLVVHPCHLRKLRQEDLDSESQPELHSKTCLETMAKFWNKKVRARYRAALLRHKDV